MHESQKQHKAVFGMWKKSNEQDLPFIFTVIFVGAQQMRVWKAEQMQSTRWMTSFVENGEVFKTSCKCRLTAPTPLQKARRSYQTFIQKNTETELSRMAIHNWTIWPHFRAIANWHLHIDIHSKSSTFLKRFCRILHPRKLRHDNGNTNIWRCISWLPIVFHLSPS